MVTKSIELDDKLYKALCTFSEQSGLDLDQIINLALFELCRKYGYVQIEPIVFDAPIAAEPVQQSAPVKSDGKPRRRATPVAHSQYDGPLQSNQRAIHSNQPAMRSNQPEPVYSEDSGRASLYYQVNNGPLTQVDKELFLIGRGSTCDLSIRDRAISREHVLISRNHQGWYLEDLGSANGTYLNGKRIAKYKIMGGEQFQISSYTIKFVLK